MVNTLQNIKFSKKFRYEPVQTLCDLNERQDSVVQTLRDLNERQDSVIQTWKKWTRVKDVGEILEEEKARRLENSSWRIWFKDRKKSIEMSETCSSCPDEN